MKIIGMLSVYNDGDIIKEVIEHLLTQNLELVVLDNGSTDGSFEICRKFQDKGILQLNQFQTDTFNEFLVYRMLYDMTIAHNPDWVVKIDSDEFLESGISKMNLKDTIIQVDKEGYNLIQFDRFDFFMTDDDKKNSDSIKNKLRYYSCQGDFLYRSWKYIPGITIGGSNGHYPVFPGGIGYNIFSKKFVLRHYPFRSKEQSKKKISGRLRGINLKQDKKEANRLLGKSNLNTDFSKTFDHHLLSMYEEDGNWNHEIKLIPYANPKPPKREDIFTNEGKLKEIPKTPLEYKRLLQEEQGKPAVKAINRIHDIKEKFLQKFSKE